MIVLYCIVVVVVVEDVVELLFGRWRALVLLVSTWELWEY